MDSDQLLGEGIAATFTMTDIPASSSEFHAARRALIRRLERLGMQSYHWVIEWTRRRRPHLHMALYWPAGTDALQLGWLRAEAVRVWLDVCSEWGTGAAAQHLELIEGPLGWLQYLSKHAARGVGHYQRQGKPTGWETTGRLWGFGGEWPTVEPMVHEVSRQTYWRYRRLVRSWRIADARKALVAASTDEARAAARRRLCSARAMLAAGQRNLSEVRGISEWIPESTHVQLIGLLGAEGHFLLQR